MDDKAGQSCSCLPCCLFCARHGLGIREECLSGWNLPIVNLLFQMSHPILHDDCVHRPLHVRYSHRLLTASHTVQPNSETHTTAEGCRRCGQALLCNMHRIFYAIACVVLSRGEHAWHTLKRCCSSFLLSLARVRDRSVSSPPSILSRHHAWCRACVAVSRFSGHTSSSCFMSSFALQHITSTHIVLCSAARCMVTLPPAAMHPLVALQNHACVAKACNAATLRSRTHKPGQAVC